MSAMGIIASVRARFAEMEDYINEARQVRETDPDAFRFVCEQRVAGRGKTKEDRQKLLEEFRATRAKG